MLSLNILSNRGRSIRPKTLNQKKYVESIDKHTITFGISDNRVKPVDNSRAGHLGYAPQDTTEPYRAALEARTPPLDPYAPETLCYGGAFVTYPHPDDPAR